MTFHTVNTPGCKLIPQETREPFLPKTPTNPLSYMRKVGWGKNAAVDLHGRVCMTGAMRNTYVVWRRSVRHDPLSIARIDPFGDAMMPDLVDGRVPTPAEERALVEVIRAEFPERLRRTGTDAVAAAFDFSVPPVIVIQRFNDHPDTTRDDVEMVLGKVYGEEV